MDFKDLIGDEVEILSYKNGSILVAKGTKVFKIVGEFKIEEINL